MVTILVIFTALSKLWKNKVVLRNSFDEYLVQLCNHVETNLRWVKAWRT